ncbi:MAG: hypothetical protein FWG84_05650 [Bacteroidales bacterium]|nr:hypothetical protein [Bacteroidales bacterium]
MKDIEKAINLYRLMASRCERTGHSPRQTRVYREMVEFMQDCDSADAAAVKIRNSKYFLAPAAALLQDKLAALERASRESDMPDVADVYKKKIEEIDADPTAMYETGYDATVKNLKKAYFDTYNAFVRIFVAYFKLSCYSVLDKTTAITLDALRADFAALSKPSSDFAQLAALEKFRSLIPVTDAGYARFVKEAPILAANGPDYAAEKQSIEEELKALQQLVAAEKDAVAEAGRVNKQKMRQSQTIAVAPDSQTGAYTYIEEKTINY